MDFFKMFSKKTSSGDIARERLKLLLIHDRADFSPKMLEMLKRDIIKVISNYMEIDERDMDIQISTSSGAESENPTLSANIPIKNMRKGAK